MACNPTAQGSPARMPDVEWAPGLATNGGGPCQWFGCNPALTAPVDSGSLCARGLVMT